MRTMSTPRRQYATLGGEWEITTTDVRRATPPGSLVLLDGMTGRGHNTTPRVLKGLRPEKKPGLIRRSPLSTRGPF